MLNFFKENRIIITRIFVVVIFLEIFFLPESIEIESTGALLWEVPGLILMGIATLGRLWSLLYICDKKTQTLVTQGPYSIVRNPLYVFSFCGALGLGLSSENFAVLATILVFYIFYYPFVVISEEQKLQSIHGDLFEQYKSKVPRFIPRFRLYQEAETIQINNLKYRKYFFDAMWFIWFYMLLEIIEKIKLVLNI